MAMMDSKHETVKEFETAFTQAIDTMSSIEDVSSHITRENYGKGLHVHKMTKKIGDVEQKVAKVWDLMSKSGGKIEQHYPPLYAKWQDTMQLQAWANKEISTVKRNSGISFGEMRPPPLGPFLFPDELPYSWSIPSILLYSFPSNLLMPLFGGMRRFKWHFPKICLPQMRSFR